MAVEADWPDAYRVNRYVLGDSDDGDAIAALADFKRFPGWMWRNFDMVDFVMWLAGHNAQAGWNRKVRFYGLDLYSLQASMDAVVTYLDSVDSDAAAQARGALQLLRPVGGRGAGVRARGDPRPDAPVRERSGGPIGRSPSPGGRTAGARRLGGRGRALLRRAERPSGP